MQALTLPFKSLVDPVDAVPRAVQGRRWVVPLLLLMASSSVAGAIVAQRVDVQPRVVAGLRESGELEKKSEREISEAVEQAQRLALVTGVAGGLLAVPLVTLLGALALRFWAWLFGLKTSFGALFSAMATAQLPFVVLRVLTAVVAFKQQVIVEKRVSSLLMTSLSQWLSVEGVHAKRLLTAVDFFNLWSVGLLGLGLSAAASLTKTKGLAMAVFLYLLFAALMFVALPGLNVGGPGHGGHR